MSFQDLAEKTARTCFAKLGEAATYTPVTTSVATAVTVVPHYDVVAFPGGFESAISEPQTEIDLLYEEVGNPKRGDTIQIGDELWTVEDVLPAGGNDRNVVRVVVK